MIITAQNLSAHELVGLEASVAESSNPALASIRGRIVYETKNLLVLQAGKGIVKIPKSTVRLVVTLPDGSTCAVDGRDLVGRPEDRVQRLR